MLYVIIKEKLSTVENINNILLNVALVEILVEKVKTVVDVNGCVLCLIFSALLSLVSYCLSERLTWRQLLLYFYNFLVVFLASVGSYESIIKILTK